MEYKYLIKTLEGPLGIITINNPKANALSSGLVFELDAVFTELENEKSVVVVIITGYGNKFFVAGADINDFVNKNANEGKEISRKLQIVLNKIENSPKIVIAAINGYCLGGGLELAMACDFRYASDNAELGQPEIDLGLIPGAGGTQRLPRLIGKGKAKELIFSGIRIKAKEALELQLIQKISSQDNLLTETKEMALIIAKKSSLILKYAKDAINKGIEGTLESGLLLEAENFGLCFASADKIEGVNAFLEKRPPNFKGV